MRVLMTGAAAALILSGCAGSNAPVGEELPTDPTPPTADQSFVDCFDGDPATLTGLSASEAQAAHTKGPVRVIAPGALITQDYNPERLNLVTDAKAAVVRIYCG